MSEKDQAQREQRLQQAFFEYQKLLDAGQEVDSDKFLARYPDVADSLADALKADAAVRELAGPTYAQAGMDSELEAILARTAPSPPHVKETLLGNAAGDTHPESHFSQSDLPVQFGRYRVERLLGQGAMGSVYLAHDTQLDRRVALKIPKFDERADGELLERFYREARAVATLHHPNICPVYDVGEIGGRTFISMGFIDGRPLSDYAKQGKRQGDRSIARLMMNLALALREAHEIGVVHRDLKPANIMVNRKGKPVVMDFGLARRLDSDDTRVTRSGTIVGTPAYMSPEQVEGLPDSVGPASDQYSLGVILYEMLAGQLPFSGTVLSVVGQIAHKEPRQIEQLCPDVDTRLTAICRRMMAKDATDRYTDMAAVAEALNDYLAASKSASSAEASLWDVNPHAVVSSTTKPEQVRPTSRVGWRFWSAVGVLGSLAAIAAGIVLYLQGTHGTVRIEITDPQIRVEFVGKTLTLDDNGTEIEVEPGPHALRVKRGGLGFTTREFTVTKNGEVAIHVTWKDNVLLAKRDGATIGSVGRQSPRAVPVAPEIALVRRFAENDAWNVRGIAFTPDGRHLLTGAGTSMPRALLLHDVANGHLVHRFNEAPINVFDLEISPDGQYAVIGDRLNILIYDLPNRKRLHNIPAHKKAVTYVAVSPDNTFAVSSGAAERTVAVWDLKSGRELSRIEVPHNVGGVAVMPNGQLLVGARASSPVCELWDWKLKQRVRSFDVRETVNDLTVSSDGRYMLAAGEKGMLTLVDLRSDKLWELHGHTDHVWSARFLPNGAHCISGSFDGTLRLWSLDSKQQIASVSSENRLFNALAVTPDGRQVAAGGGYVKGIDGEERPTDDYGIRLWQLPRSAWPKTATPAIAPFDAGEARGYQTAWARHLRVDVESTNSLGMKMRLIPPGEFLMGAREEDFESLTSEETRKLRIEAECPQHQVSLTEPYWLGATEVTVAQFRRFVEDTGYKTEAERDGNGGVATELSDGKMKISRRPEWIWTNPGFEQTDDSPVVQVSWNDAVAFCNWLSRQDGLHPAYRDDGAGSWQQIEGATDGFRLPYDAEWEFACRAGTTTLNFFGDDLNGMGEFAWFQQNSGGKSHSVAARQANPFGLFDILGNAGEWVQDRYVKNYYQSSPRSNPRGPAAGVGRVRRGWTWTQNLKVHFRCTLRFAFDPSARHWDTGFRVARNATPEES